MRTGSTVLLLLSVWFLVFLACSKHDNSDEQAKTVLLTKITQLRSGDPRANIVYEYDSVNRLKGWKHYNSDDLHATAIVVAYNNNKQPAEIQIAYANGVKDTTRYIYNPAGQITVIDFMETPAHTTTFTYTADTVTEKAIQKPSTVLYTRKYARDASGNFSKVFYYSGSTDVPLLVELTGYDTKKSPLSLLPMAYWSYQHPFSEGIPLSPVNNYALMKIVEEDGNTMQYAFSHQYQQQGYISSTSFIVEGKEFEFRYEYNVR